MKSFIAPFLGLISLCAVSHAELTYQADSILVSTGTNIYEYDTDGLLRSQAPIAANASGEQARDLIVTNNASVSVFNGTFNPELSTFDGQTWSTETIPGWSTASNLSYGGITSTGNRIFLTDGNTYQAEDRGIIVYDTATGSHQRILTGSDYIDVTVGLDGLLYALRNSYGDLDIVDPENLALINTVDLGHTSGSRGVTADQAGNIYMVSWNGYVAKYLADGTLVTSLSLGSNPYDIDIDISGDILIGGRFGDVYVTDTSLSTFSHFTAGSASVFVAFASRQDVIAPPVVTASSTLERARYITTLEWTTAASAVDIYLNGALLETISGASGSATYEFHKKDLQVFTVCNSGTSDCAESYDPANSY